MNNCRISALAAALLLVFSTTACAQNADVTSNAAQAIADDGVTETRRNATGDIPPLDSQITMFYYQDIEKASDFYGDILGLTLEFDWTWIRFYKTGPASSIGIVTEGEGAWYDAQAKNAVMLSLVTSDVDAWYERLQPHDEIVFLKDIGDGGGIRNFMLEDPGGYTVEFFQWLEPEE